MKYYAYFDAYGHAKQIITAQDLTDNFNNDPHNFLTAMCQEQPDAPAGHTTGHVGTLSFDTEKELQEYLEGLGDEITGFYGCRSASRPYNF